jgi:hydroxymethylpyrimidine/phosphomethylpyrimidine kinase
MTKTYKRALTIAGSDSGGGAGIQADIKTFSALGCYGMSVITALTAQNTRSVTGIHPVPPSFVEQQMEAVLTDIGVDAVKIGMLFSMDLIRAVARQLEKHCVGNIVLDPVMVAQSGDKLLQDDAIEAIKDYLMPLADVVTPNLPEAAVLLKRDPQDLVDLSEAARSLSVYGSKNILVKGGHGTQEDSTDVLFIAHHDRLVHLEGNRIDTRNNHGTGCTLSSAIAAYMAVGNSIEDAVKKAKEYITSAIQCGKDYVIGSGHGPVHHFFNFWDGE